MRFIFILAAVCLVCGCSPPNGAAFDRFLATNRIVEIEIVEYEKQRTNLVRGAQVARLLTWFAATNRVSARVQGKSYVSGHMALSAEGRAMAYLTYFPREQILSYQDYGFRLRDTNAFAALFR